MVKIFVVGDNGMVGSTIYWRFSTQDNEIITAFSADLDLVDRSQV